MTTMTLTNPVFAVAPAHTVSPIQELVEQLRGNAIAQARQRLAMFQREEELTTLLEQPVFLGAFVHALASGVAEVLAENDKYVQAVYVFDPSLNPDSESGDNLPISPTVHLLIRVTKPSAALEAFIASLDQALTARLRELPSSKFAQRTSVLAVNLLTEEDVRLGTGYAAMLSSVFAPPLKVWQRRI